MPVGTAMPVALDKMAACDTLGCLYSFKWRKKTGQYHANKLWYESCHKYIVALA